MKNHLITLSFLALSGLLNAQTATWNGNGTTGNANRSGNIGINNTSPVYALDIKTGVSNDGISITQTGGEAAALHLTGNPSSSGKHWALFSTGSSNGQGGGHFSIYDYSAYADRFFISGASGIAGNIGIGNTSPQHKLDVTGTVRAEAFKAKTWNNAASVFEIENTNFAVTPFLIKGDGTTYIGSGRPNANGPASTAKLTVDGKVLAKDFYVAISAGSASTNYWADYVFNKDYKLMSLEKVKEFTINEKHLPGVPSACDIEQSGLNIAEMQKIQMEKIEELYLHVIKLNEKIESLEKENAELKK